MEKVSIIVPVYNASKVIERCIESIIKQTYEDIEIICINDGSKDDSLNILKKLSIKDKRIRIIDKVNGGVSSARNAGLNASKGKYIMFVDSDDYLLDTLVYELVNEIEKNNTDWVISNHIIKDNENIKNNFFVGKDNVMNRIEFIKKFNIYYSKSIFNQPWNKLYIREKINFYFDESKSLGEDLLFNIQYVNKIDNISYLNKNLYVYDISQDNSLTKKYRHTPEQFLYLYEEIYNKLFYKNGVFTSISFNIFTLKHYTGFINQKNNENTIEKRKDTYKFLVNFLNNTKNFYLYERLKKRLVFSKIVYFLINILYFILKR